MKKRILKKILKKINNLKIFITYKMELRNLLFILKNKKFFLAYRKYFMSWRILSNKVNKLKNRNDYLVEK